MAARFGLKVHVGDSGYFWGPGNTLEPYNGKMMGLVHIRFAEDVQMVLLELHLVDGTRKDPLFIIGADMMAPEHPGSWDFLHVGFHPGG